ncbi:MAG: acetolactate synthase small subunit [Lentisphaerae bacterium]|nr:acetolactate synthase small subunit [Lentisphaerota bacterium]
MTTILTETDTHTLSVYVANKPGVLARIAQVFARRGYNIDSLTVSPSVDGRYSRMTITAKGSVEGLDQILRQVSKLVDVLRCTDHSLDEAVVREMALIKFTTKAGERTEALQICEHFGCKTVDLTEDSMIVQITGGSEKLEACIDMLGKFGIVELVRTGKVLMARGRQET